MPLDLALASVKPSSTGRAQALGPHTAMRATTHAPLVAAAALPVLASHPLTRRYPCAVTVPRDGELHIWRFRCEWLPVSVQEGDSWLSRGERERARLHPNGALRKRFISARVVVRWIVGNLFACEPQVVDLQDDGHDKLRARHPHDGRGIVIDIAYGGIWIVIGIAPAALGLAVNAPTPRALVTCPDGEQRRARYTSVCNALRYAPVEFEPDLLLREADHRTTSHAYDLAGHGRWHVLDVPMPGRVHAAVALPQPVTLVQAIGWPKSARWSPTD